MLLLLIVIQDHCFHQGVCMCLGVCVWVCVSGCLGEYVCLSLYMHALCVHAVLSLSLQEFGSKHLVDHHKYTHH